MLGASSLSSMTPEGPWARVRALAGDAEEAHALRAMGLFEGQRVRVLRRGPLGGPLHLRAESGAEFAVDRAVADRIDVTVDPEAPAPSEPAR
jgi:Fe2+ transport system protein FeoA